MGVVVPYLNANHKCIIVRVVEAPDIFLYKLNDRVVDLCHLRDEFRQLDIVDHPQVSFACLFGRARCRGSSYDHSYVC